MHPTTPDGFRFYYMRAQCCREGEPYATLSNPIKTIEDFALRSNASTINRVKEDVEEMLTGMGLRVLKLVVEPRAIQ